MKVSATSAERGVGFCGRSGVGRRAGSGEVVEDGLELGRRREVDVLAVLERLGRAAGSPVEGFAGGELKHGVIALVAEGFRAGVAQREIDRREIDDIESLERRDQVLLARAVVRNEMGIMTISVIAVVTLALRAFATGS